MKRHPFIESASTLAIFTARADHRWTLLTVVFPFLILSMVLIGCEGGWKVEVSSQAAALLAVTRTCDMRVSAGTSASPSAPPSPSATPVAAPPELNRKRLSELLLAPTCDQSCEREIDGLLAPQPVARLAPGVNAHASFTPVDLLRVQLVRFRSAPECTGGCRRAIGFLMHEDDDALLCMSARDLVQLYAPYSTYIEGNAGKRVEILARWLPSSYWALLCLVVYSLREYSLLRRVREWIAIVFTLVTALLVAGWLFVILVFLLSAVPWAAWLILLVGVIVGGVGWWLYRHKTARRTTVSLLLLIGAFLPAYLAVARAFGIAFASNSWLLAVVALLGGSGSAVGAIKTLTEKGDEPK